MRYRIYVLLLITLAGGGHNTLAESGAPLAGQPELRQLLQQEMRALQEAVGTLGQALVQGDWQTLAKTAGQMHDSFIFQQKLTDADRELLHQNLPSGFIQQDKGFHQRAKKLQQAALVQDAELSLFYYSKMLESCVSCHSQYATHRFPSLAGSAPLEHAH